MLLLIKTTNMSTSLDVFTLQPLELELLVLLEGLNGLKGLEQQGNETGSLSV